MALSHPRSLPLHVVYALILGGVAGVAMRHAWRAEAGLTARDTAWRLTYEIECESRRAGSELSLATPADTPYCRVARQDIRQENLRIDPRGRSSSQAREVVALTADRGRAASVVRFDLRLDRRGVWSWNGSATELAAEERAEYLRSEPGVPVADERVAAVIRELRGRSSSLAELAHAIFVHCQRGILCAGEDASDDVAEVLELGRGTPRGCVRAMITLCRAARIPARPVCGFIVETGERESADTWLEILVDGQWIPYDPVNGYERVLPHNYVPARRGNEQVVLAPEIDDLEFEYTVTRLPRASLGPAASGSDFRDVLDLTRLPLEIQRTLSLILLMPIGALVTAAFRNLVGVPTSGTFTPTLLALSFASADWPSGLAILGAAIVLGLAARYLVDRLKLLILPRLSVMLTAVVLSIVFGISAIDVWQTSASFQAALLPMVIVTMLVERLYLTTQEDGERVALQHLAGTCLVGFCCYLVFRWDAVAALLLAYPELHLFTIALLVLIGRYTGYQLTELYRFRDFAEARTR